MSRLLADTDYVDGAVAKLQEQLAREIRRLDARMNSLLMSNDDVVDVVLQSLYHSGVTFYIFKGT